jgi:hypothetical protein
MFTGAPFRTAVTVRSAKDGPCSRDLSVVYPRYIRGPSDEKDRAGQEHKKYPGSTILFVVTLFCKSTKRFQRRRRVSLTAISIAIYYSELSSFLVSRIWKAQGGQPYRVGFFQVIFSREVKFCFFCCSCATFAFTSQAPPFQGRWANAYYMKRRFFCHTSCGYSNKYSYETMFERGFTHSIRDYILIVGFMGRGLFFGGFSGRLSTLY